jgi:uncharacterized CHY-type Zn-finger protein
MRLKKPMYFIWIFQRIIRPAQQIDIVNASSPESAMARKPLTVACTMLYAPQPTFTRSFSKKHPLLRRQKRKVSKDILASMCRKEVSIRVFQRTDKSCQLPGFGMSQNEMGNFHKLIC